MRHFRLMILAILLVTVLSFLQYRLWFEKGGILELLRLKKVLATQISENEKLKKRNEELLFQVQRFKQGHDAAESRARNELGMIKKGETFYQIVR